MKLDLERILSLTQKGQWSIDDIDWEKPFDDDLTPRQKLEAGRSLLLVAGLEKQAAMVFRLCSEFVDEPTAKQIYKLFEADELRHAEAEEKLAERYGVSYSDLPPGARGMFKWMNHDLKTGDQYAIHEFSSSTILLFELALDSLLLPALKELTTDSVQADVFRRIDADESRHLAMDYWLLDRKGLQQKGKSMQDLLGDRNGPLTLKDKLQGKFGLWSAFVVIVAGFGSVAIRTKSLRGKLLAPDKVEKYLEKVAAIPDKAPHAMDAPTFRIGLKGQERLIKLLQFVTQNRVAARMAT